MAVDRSNLAVAALYNPLHPGFLQLLRAIVTMAHRAGRWVGLCGEMGGQPECLPLLVGLGLDEISMSSTRIATTKSALARLSAASCADLLDRALACPTASDVAALVLASDRSNELPLLDVDLIALDVDARSKDEAIKAAADRLYAAGRTERPRDVEEAVWAREAAFSTGFGHGFAVPHARTDAVRSASLAFVRLRTPVVWGSLDDKAVEVVLLLTLRASDAPKTHLQILATLSRSLMHEEFRERLRLETDAGDLCAFLCQTLRMS